MAISPWLTFENIKQQQVDILEIQTIEGIDPRPQLGNTLGSSDVIWYVANSTGIDDLARDPSNPATAWKTLEFMLEHIANTYEINGVHIIQFTEPYTQNSNEFVDMANARSVGFSDTIIVNADGHAFLHGEDLWIQNSDVPIDFVSSFTDGNFVDANFDFFYAQNSLCTFEGFHFINTTRLYARSGGTILLGQEDSTVGTYNQAARQDAAILRGAPFVDAIGFKMTDGNLDAGADSAIWFCDSGVWYAVYELNESAQACAGGTDSLINIDMTFHTASPLVMADRGAAGNNQLYVFECAGTNSEVRMDNVDIEFRDCSEFKRGFYEAGIGSDTQLQIESFTISGTTPATIPINMATFTNREHFINVREGAILRYQTDAGVGAGLFSGIASRWLKVFNGGNLDIQSTQDPIAEPWIVGGVSTIEGNAIVDNGDFRANGNNLTSTNQGDAINEIVNGGLSQGTYADDTAAAGGGVAIGQFYNTAGGDLKVRLV